MAKEFLLRPPFLGKAPVRGNMRAPKESKKNVGSKFDRKWHKVVNFYTFLLKGAYCIPFLYIFTKGHTVRWGEFDHLKSEVLIISIIKNKILSSL
jgi:hypothetical protein